MAANDTVTAPSGEQVAYGYHKPDTVPKFWRGSCRLLPCIYSAIPRFSDERGCHGLKGPVSPYGESIQPINSRFSFCLSRLKLIPSFLALVFAFRRVEKYEKEAGKFWNSFYKTHNANFFKDRHWTDREFDELRGETLGSTEAQASTEESSSSEMTYALEVGCGVGNTVFPLLEVNPKLFFYAVDFAAHAIDLLKQNEVYKSTGRCSGHVVDMVKDPLPAEIAPQSLDVVMMIFVLSAISPENFDAVIAKLAAVRLIFLITAFKSVC